MNKLVYLRDGSAQPSARAATSRYSAVVKALALDRFDSCFRRGVGGIFPVTSDLQIGTPVDASPGAWRL